MPRRPPQPVRLFVAAHPPPEVALAMLEALAALNLPAHRAVPAAQVHLTLQFIGDTEPRRLQDVAESVERSCAGIEAFVLTPLRLIALPQKGPARLVALETDAPPALLELQRRLAHRLARSVRDRPGDRFLPHLTLARLTTPGAIGPLPDRLDIPPFPVRRVTLMRSVLLPEGAEHREAAAFPLEAGDQPGPAA